MQSYETVYRKYIFLMNGIVKMNGRYVVITELNVLSLKRLFPSFNSNLIKYDNLNFPFQIHSKIDFLLFLNISIIFFFVIWNFKLNQLFAIDIKPSMYC